MKHNHTPWPEYRKSLTTAGYDVEYVNETVDGIMETWSCPACVEAEGLQKEVAVRANSELAES